MIVLKFGGTSVQDAAAMNQALDITQAYLTQAPLLVSSAMSGVTNALIALTEAAQAGLSAETETRLADLETRHQSVLDTLKTPELKPRGLALLAEVFEELKALLRGVRLLGECSPRVYDAVVGAGELLSTRLLTLLAQDRGWSAELLDSRRLIVTDDHFGEAAVDWPRTRSACAALAPRPGHLLIAQGFIGATPAGVATILGRGGSDYSATVYGAVLGAAEVQIWTDVNGIMTTDPRKVPEARSIPEMTYEEAAELAYFGAKVVHPATIQPAVEKGIPVWVKNTKNPQHPGTAIRPLSGGTGLRALSTKKNIRLVTVSSSRMLNAYGFLARIFDIFQKHRIPVDLVATSEVSVSMTVDRGRDLSAALQDLEQLGAVKVDETGGILCLVGRDLWKDTSVLVRTFQALGPIPIQLISLGASDINLSLVIPEEHLDTALAQVHREFFR